MKKTTLFLLFTGLILILIAGYVLNNKSLSEPELKEASSIAEGSYTTEQDTVIEDKEQASDFTVTDLQGNKVSLQDLKGKNVYINFWATWCKWCKKEMPDLEKVYQEYKNENIVFLAISIGEDRDKVQNYINEHNYQFNVLLDEDKSVAKAYKLKSIPVSLFIDKDGNIAYQRVGAMTEEQMRVVIDELLAVG